MHLLINNSIKLIYRIVERGKMEIRKSFPEIRRLRNEQFIFRKSHFQPINPSC